MINDENCVRNSRMCEGLGNSREYRENSLGVEKFPRGYFLLKCKFPGVENSLGLIFYQCENIRGKNSHVKISMGIFEHTVNTIFQNQCQ